MFEYDDTATGVVVNDCDVDGVGTVCWRASLHSWADDVLRSITLPSIPSVSAMIVIFKICQINLGFVQYLLKMNPLTVSID